MKTMKTEKKQQAKKMKTMKTEKKQQAKKMKTMKTEKKQQAKKMVKELLKLGAINTNRNELCMYYNIVQYRAINNIFYLDLLTTDVKHRKMGYAKKTLQALCSVAKQMECTIKLTCGTIVNNGNNSLVNQIASDTINAIPVNDLPEFFTKNGFIMDGLDDNGNVMMIFN